MHPCANQPGARAEVPFTPKEIYNIVRRVQEGHHPTEDVDEKYYKDPASELPIGF